MSYLTLKKNRSRVIYIDEEGGVYPKHLSDEIFEKRYNSRDMILCDVILAWGKRQHQILTEKGLRSICVGHPRFSIKQNKNLNSEDPIIIMTNFSLLTSALSFKSRYFDEDIYSERLWHQTQDLAALLMKINTIGPNKDIIIRPHPSEDIQLYIDLFRNLENVKVQKNIELRDAFSSISAHYHFDCTTSLTALSLGIPTVNLGKIPTTIISDINDGSLTSDWLLLPHNEKLMKETIYSEIQSVSSTKINAISIIISAYLLETVYALLGVVSRNRYQSNKFGKFFLKRGIWKIFIC